MDPLTIGLLIAAAAAAVYGTAGGITSATQNTKHASQKESLIAQLMAKGLSRTDAEAIISNYSQDTWDFFSPSSWGKTGDAYNTDALWQDWEEYLANADKFKLPDLPEYDKLRAEAEAQAIADLDAEDNTRIAGYQKTYNEALAELDKLYSENEEAYQKLFNDNTASYNQLYNANQDIYNLLAENTKSELQNQLSENNAMFQDYRNQVLTNNAMQNQAIAGSTRYELERAQRNAISRGASAAQRLVSNINAQLGIQAQAAQQSLNTSNVLAQQLLAQRQAATQLRGQYLDSQMDLAKSQLANRNQLASNQLSNRNQFFSNQNANRNNYATSKQGYLNALNTNINNLNNSRVERLSALKGNYGNMAVNSAREAYDSQYDRYIDSLGGLSGNPFSKYGQQQASRNRYNSGI